MADSSTMQLNKLNYDREREMVDFAMRRKLGDTAIVINGEVPVMMLAAGDIRGFAKAAVRQALLDAADALTGTEDGEEIADRSQPDDLDAANFD